jgi:hypothetical protein
LYVIIKKISVQPLKRCFSGCPSLLQVFGDFPEWSMEARHAPDALARHQNYRYNKWMNMFDFWRDGHANAK